MNRVERNGGALAAMRHRSFAVAWTASLVSGTGSWLQQLAVPVVIYQITGSTLWLGIAGFSGMVSSALTTLTGGLLADRHDRRRILIVTNLVQAVCAAGLWLLSATGHVRVGYMIGLLILAGLVSGVGVSAWQSIQPLLVPRELILSAVRLNSTQYAISRAVGPAIGALALRAWGASTCFALNALSFLAVVAAMITVSTRPTPDGAAARSSLRADLALGWRYLRSSQALWIPSAAIICTAFLNVTWTGLTAAIADRQYGHPARDSGLLVTSYGIGSVVTSVVSARVFPNARRSAMFTVSCLSAITGLSLTAATRTFEVGLAGLFCVGIAHMLTSLSLNTAVQLHAHDLLRGRVTAIYLQGALLGNALGSIVNAKMADALGIRTALLIDATLLAVVLSLVFRVRQALDYDRAVDPVDAVQPARM